MLFALCYLLGHESWTRDTALEEESMPAIALLEDLRAAQEDLCSLFFPLCSLRLKTYGGWVNLFLMK